MNSEKYALVSSWRCVRVLWIKDGLIKTGMNIMSLDTTATISFSVIPTWRTCKLLR